MNLLDHPIISSRYFFPRSDPPEHPWWVNTPAGKLACWRTPPRHGRTVLFFHGNGEVVADYLPWWPNVLHAMGWDLALAEYRGYGGSAGEPQLHAMQADALSVLDALQVPDENVVVFGRSVGSIYALHVAARRAVAGLVLESGISDVLQRLLLRMLPEELGVGLKALTQAVHAHSNAKENAVQTTCPSLILHARHDSLVGVEHARALASWLAGPVTVEILPHGDHNSVLLENQQDYLGALHQFLQQTSTSSVHAKTNPD